MFNQKRRTSMNIDNNRIKTSGWGRLLGSFFLLYFLNGGRVGVAKIAPYGRCERCPLATMGATPWQVVSDWSEPMVLRPRGVRAKALQGVEAVCGIACKDPTATNC